MPLRALVASTDPAELEWAARALSSVLPLSVPTLSADPAVVKAALSGEGTNLVILFHGLAEQCDREFPLVSAVPVALLYPVSRKRVAESLIAKSDRGQRPAALAYADQGEGFALLSAWVSGLAAASMGYRAPEPRKAGEVRRRSAGDFERRYEDLVHALPDIVYELDVEGVFTFVNESVSILGYRPDELVGRHFSVLFYDDEAASVDRNQVLADYAGHKTGQALSPKLFNERRGRNRRTCDLEVRLRRKPVPGVPRQDLIGEVISYGEISAAGEYARDGQGEFRGSVGIIRDVTLRRKSEDMLRKLYQAVDQLGSCVFVVNHAFETEYVNPSFFLLTGFSPGDVIGASIFRFFAFMPEAAELMRKHVQDGFDVREEVLVPRARGGQFWADFSISPVRSPSGFVTHAIAIIDDISARKAMEELLKSARSEAENANHAKTSFLASMTHELKNPISGILAAAELLLVAPEDAAKRAATINSQARYLLDIITGILDYVRSEGGDGSVQRLAFPLKAFMEDLRSRFAPQAEAKGLSLEFESDENETIDGDPDRIGKAISILVDNAVKYTENGAVSVRARVERQEGNLPHLVVSVEDTGIGIRADDHDRIFQPFARVGAKRGVEGRGAGIGLALARNIVKVLGGEIRLQSEPGSGSSFTLIVPSGSPAPLSVNASESPYTVLIVDDNEVNLEYMRTLMENTGYRVITASGAAEAFRTLEARYVDAAVLDIQMPGYSGVELAKAIRAYAGSSYSPGMPLFAMTAHDASEIEPAGALFHGVFTKPADIRRLADAIAGSMAERETVSAVYFNTSYPERGGERQAALASLRASTDGALAHLKAAVEGSGDARIDVRAEANKLSLAFQRFASPAGMDLVRQLLEHYAREDHAVLSGIVARLKRMLDGAYRNSSAGIERT